MKISKNTTNHEYIHGDLDKDRVPNIDDQKPYDKANNERVNKEVSLSKTLKTLDQHHRNADRVARPYAKARGLQYRVKDNYSTIAKLVKKGFTDKETSRRALGDYIGFRRTVDGKRVDAERQWNKFKPRTAYERDNKYVTNRWTNNPYRALHTNFTLKSGPKRVYNAEAQFRTAKFGLFNDDLHKYYKNGKISRRALRKSVRLRKQGY